MTIRVATVDKYDLWYRGSLFLFARKSPVRRVCRKLIQHRGFETIILIAILMNCITLAMDDPTNPSETLAVFEVVFTCIFGWEMLVKSIANGFYFLPDAYLKNPWNRFDFLLVLSGIVGLFVEASNLTILRLFRLLRPIRTVRGVERLKVIMDCIINSIGALAKTCLLLLFFFFFFSILGLYIFSGVLDGSGNINASFDNIGVSILTTLECLLLEGWSEVMYDTMDETSAAALLFFLLIIFFGSFFMLNFTVAVLKNNYSIAFAPILEKEVLHVEAAEYDEQKKLAVVEAKHLAAAGVRRVSQVTYQHAVEEAGRKGVVVPELQMMGVGSPEAPGRLDSTDFGTKSPTPPPRLTPPCSGTSPSGHAPIPTKPVPADIATATAASATPTTVSSYAEATAPTGSSHQGITATGNTASTPSEGGTAGSDRNSKRATGTGTSTTGGDGPPALGVFGTIASGISSMLWGRSGTSWSAVEGSGNDDSDSLPGKAEMDSSLRKLTREMSGTSYGGDSALSNQVSESPDVSYQMPIPSLVYREETVWDRVMWYILYAPAFRMFRVCFAVVRRVCVRINSSAIFTGVMFACILLNTVVLAMDGPFIGSSLSHKLSTMNLVLSIVFGVEMFVRVVALGPVEYVQDRFNVFDGVVVILGFVEIGMSGSGSLSALRALRLFRVLRVFKMARHMASLQQIVDVMVASYGQFGYLSLLLMLFIFTFSVGGMQLFAGTFPRDPIDPAYVARPNFDTLFDSFLSVFQILTLEDFPILMWKAMESTSYWAAFFFLIIIFLGSFVLLELFLAMLLENFEAIFKKEKMEERKRQVATLVTKTLGEMTQISQKMKRPKRLSAVAEDATSEESAQARASAFESLGRRLSAFKRPSRPSAVEAADSQQANSFPFSPGVMTSNGRDPNTKSYVARLSRQYAAVPTTFSVPEDMTICPEETVRPCHDTMLRAAAPVSVDITESERTEFEEVSSDSYSNDSGDSDEDSLGSTEEGSMGSKGGAASSGESGRRRSSVFWPLSWFQSPDTDAEPDSGRVERTNSFVTAPSESDDEGRIMPEECVALGGSSGVIGAEEIEVVPVDALDVTRKPPSRGPIRSALAKRRFTISGAFTSSPDGPSKPVPGRQVTFDAPASLDVVDENGIELQAVGRPDSPKRQGGHGGHGGGERKSKTGTRHFWRGRRPSSIASESPNVTARMLASRMAAAEARDSLAKVETLRKQHSRLALGEHMTTTLVGMSLGTFSPDSKFRKICARVAVSPQLNAFVMICIFLSCILLAGEQEFSERNGGAGKTVVTVLDALFTFVFTLEFFVKVVAWGFIGTESAYMRDPWNRLDFIVLLPSLIHFALLLAFGEAPGLNAFKSLRTFRVLRPLRMIKRFAGLKIVVNAILSSLSPVANVVGVLLLVFFVFAIIGMQLFGGTFWRCTDPHFRDTFPDGHKDDCNGEYYDDDGVAHERRWVNANFHFDDIVDALMTITVVATLEGWINVMHNAMDSVDVDIHPKRDANRLAAWFFCLPRCVWVVCGD
eukprot:Rmarinus@m.8052